MNRTGEAIIRQSGCDFTLGDCSLRPVVGPVLTLTLPSPCWSSLTRVARVLSWGTLSRLGLTMRGWGPSGGGLTLIKVVYSLLQSFNYFFSASRTLHQLMDIFFLYVILEDFVYVLFGEGFDGCDYLLFLQLG